MSAARARGRPQRLPARPGPVSRSRLCPEPRGCGQEVPDSRWNKRLNSDTGAWIYDPICKDCQLRERYENKLADPAAHALSNRAEKMARELRQAGHSFITKHHVLCSDRYCPTCKGHNLAWSRLLPSMQAAIGNECLSCGEIVAAHADVDGDISTLTFDHDVAPRSPTDIQAHHARNIRLLDFSCNRKKMQMSPAEWIDAEWQAQIAEYEHHIRIQAPVTVMDPLF